MRVLIITSGFFPVTEGQGGAVEKLVEYYLNYNENEQNKIDVYSVKTTSEKYDKKKYKNTKFRIIDKTKINFRIKRGIYGILNKFTKKYIPNAYIREVVKDFNRNRNNNYDCIIFENGQDFIPYFKQKTKTKSKIILHLHNDYLNTETKNGQEIINNCDEIWAVSNFIKNRVEEINYKKIKVNLLYNTIDVTAIKKELTKEDKNKLKQKLNIENEFVFLYTGRLMKEKGVKELIIAFNELNKRYDKIKLLIVGGTKNLTDKDKYQAEIYELGKANKNIIFTGYINSNEIYKYYKISDAQVVPSICNEAFGLIVLEGIAANLPIIASNSGGIVEILGTSGNYVSRENIIKELIVKMEEEITTDNNDKILEHYPKILEKFSLEKYCTNFSNLLK